ncbi:MAG: alanine racemase [Actinomycetota bacterium]|nr:alanine racemase [Actinomycetota bacterium]
MAEGRSRPAWAEIDLAAVRHNIAMLLQVSSPAAVCAVVKADAYGHGAPAVGRAALEGGAAGLAVAIVEEGIELREAGISQPILLLSEPPADAVEAVAAGGLTPTLTTAEGVERMVRAARKIGSRISVHVKVDTGMHRMGAAPSEVPELAAAVVEAPELALEGLWTHLAVADGTTPDDRAFTSAQLERFDDVVAALAPKGIRPAVLHAGNSAAAIGWPESRYGMVRCGIAVYGQLPSPALAGALADATGGGVLRPVMALRARVAAVRTLDAGSRPSYGRMRPLPERSLVATVPIGYADGVPRALFRAGFRVLIGGRRRPLAGMVTMDQIMVDCGSDGDVHPGDEVTLLGRQGDEEITASEWAERLGTITYEVLCGIGPRVPRITDGATEAGWGSLSPTRSGSGGTGGLGGPGGPGDLAGPGTLASGRFGRGDKRVSARGTRRASGRRAGRADSKEQGRDDQGGVR